MAEEQEDMEFVDTAWDSLFSARPSTNPLTDLSIGAPGDSLLSLLPPLLLQATTHCMGQGGNILQYGPEQGVRPFRTQLAK